MEKYPNYLDTKTLAEFELWWFNRNDVIIKSQYRFGQAICNQFIVPKKIEDLLFYEEDITICRDIVWQFVQGTLEY